MKHYVGLDVSLKEVSICVVEADGAVIAEGKVATEAAEILSWIEGRVGAADRIVHESGPLSIWLTRELARRGAPASATSSGPPGRATPSSRRSPPP